MCGGWQLVTVPSFLYQRQESDVVVGSWVCSIRMFLFLYFVWEIDSVREYLRGRMGKALSSGILCFILKQAKWAVWILFVAS
jgi:hypothetical protein